MTLFDIFVYLQHKLEDCAESGKQHILKDFWDERYSMKDSSIQEPTREQNQKSFRQFLRQADKFIVDRQFEDAKREIAEARKIDPSNPFIIAFEERINLFQQKGGHAYSPALASRPGAASPQAEPKHTGVKGLEESTTHAQDEQEFRKKIEEEYKQKFTHELRKAEALAQKILDEEKQKLEESRAEFKLQSEEKIANTRRQIENDYQQKLRQEIINAEERLEQQYKSEIAFLEEGLKKQLVEGHERESTQLEERIRKEEQALLKQERDSFHDREQRLKEDYERKLLDALRKAETVFRDQTVQQQQVEKEEIRKHMMSEFQEQYEKERVLLQQQFDAAKISLQESFHAEQKRINKESEIKTEQHLEEIRQRQNEELKKKQEALRGELEEEFRQTYEAQLVAERKRIQQEAEESMEKETQRLEEYYKNQMQLQNDNLQGVRTQLRTEMEEAFLQRLQRVANEFDHKMELLGAKIPESKDQRLDFYRDKMLTCYNDGQPTVECARMLMELKELLELTFDEHLIVESDVRLKLYAECVGKKIRSGEVDPDKPNALEDIKRQFGVTAEEETRLEPYILSRFQQMSSKGKLLVADDDLLLLQTLDHVLRDNGYQVIAVEDVETALEKLQTETVDLILSDIKFEKGDMDGFKFFKAVQIQPELRRIPFVFMSALEDGVIVRSGVQLGVDDYLTKPVDPDLLFAVIEGKLKRYKNLYQN